jgi:hypothetical protein
MASKQFEEFWKLRYPKTAPIPYLFKNNYAEEWFRIHSLPEAKRYPDTEQEWNILLTRHNTTITDILGNNVKVLLVTGDYSYNDAADVHITDQEPIFLNFSFHRLPDIDLHEIDCNVYDKRQVFRPAFTETIWKPHDHDNIIREIAEDRLRAFFVSSDKEALAAPYDGGIDFILRDSRTRDLYKEKYVSWLE